MWRAWCSTRCLCSNGSVAGPSLLLQVAADLGCACKCQIDKAQDGIAKLAGRHRHWHARYR